MQQWQKASWGSDIQRASQEEEEEGGSSGANLACMDRAIQAGAGEVEAQDLECQPKGLGLCPEDNVESRSISGRGGTKWI